MSIAEIFAENFVLLSHLCIWSIKMLNFENI